MQRTKSRSQPTELYTPLNVRDQPFTNIYMNFVIDLPHTKKGEDNIFVRGSYS